jgi:hydroxymethylpyrimidine/phosphomethylpyrimidine kinase
MKRVLAIAGSDSSGGAGIQADVKSISANNAFAMTVITAITAQNTIGVNGIETVSDEMVGKQLDAIADDIRVDAIKIGMLSKKSIIKVIADKLDKFEAKIVLDPVMVSKSKHLLLEKEAISTLVEELLPKVYLVTPNLMEAEELINSKVDNLESMKQAAVKISKLGVPNVLIKGGHLSGGVAIDLLYSENKFYTFSEQFIDTNNNHGTGCTLSSAIAANIANGYALNEAIGKAKTYITHALQSGFKIGKGVGVLNHFYKFGGKK